MNIIEGKFNLITSHLNGGKTTALANLTAKASKEDKNIIYYCLDSNVEYMRKRLSSIVNINPLRNIKPSMFGLYDVIEPDNVILNSSPLDTLSLEFDIELCGNTEYIFIDTLNLFDAIERNREFDQKLKNNIEYFNGLCDKYNITIVAALNILKVQNFDAKHWNNLIGGNLLTVNNEFVIFRVYDSNEDRDIEYSIVNSCTKVCAEVPNKSEKRIKLDNLFIDGNGFEPEINFNLDENVFSIKGRAYPTRSFEFWTPVLVWMEKLSEYDISDIKLIVDLDYINSSSNGYLVKISNSLAKLNGSSIRWSHDGKSESIYELGEALEDLHTVDGVPKIKFEFINTEAVYPSAYPEIYD